jgi:NhaP-type Na+/H+ or K+/H+ antiporter
VSHYALSNISSAGRATTLTGFRTLSYVAEGMTFIYVGMDCLDPRKWAVSGSARGFWRPCLPPDPCCGRLGAPGWPFTPRRPLPSPPSPQSAYLIESIWLVLVLSVLLLVARAAFVVPFSLVHNMMPHAERFTRRDVIIIWRARGLRLGAGGLAGCAAPCLLPRSPSQPLSPALSLTLHPPRRRPRWAGLMRGAVSVAMVYLHFDRSNAMAASADRHQATLIVSTLTVRGVARAAVGAGAPMGAPWSAFVERSAAAVTPLPAHKARLPLPPPHRS